MHSRFRFYFRFFLITCNSIVNLTSRSTYSGVASSYLGLGQCNHIFYSLRRIIRIRFLPLHFPLERLFVFERHVIIFFSPCCKLLPPFNIRVIYCSSSKSRWLPKSVSNSTLCVLTSRLFKTPGKQLILSLMTDLLSVTLKVRVNTTT